MCRILLDRSQSVKLEYFIWSNEYRKPYTDLFMCFSYYSTVRGIDRKWKLWVVCGFGYNNAETQQEKREIIFAFLIMLLVTCKTKQLNSLLMWACAIRRMVPVGCFSVAACLLLALTKYFWLPHQRGLVPGLCGLIWGHFRMQFTLLIIFLQQSFQCSLLNPSLILINPV